MPKTHTNGKPETLLIIDSHALIHRAYHAFPPNLHTRDGVLVNAAFGFTKLLLDVLHKFEPDYVVAAMDSRGPTVRHSDYGAYKANRSAPDEDLINQIPIIHDLLASFNIPTLSMSGYEADDIIATLDARHSGKDKQTIIVTGDRDLFQLVDEDTYVYLAGSSFSKSQLFDILAVKEKMGVYPHQIVDLKALEGDVSDNIPGVAGIGAKSAVKLLEDYGSLTEIYQKIGQVESRYQKKLVENHELALLSYKLATVIKDSPISFDFHQANFGDFDKQELQQKFLSLEFTSLLGSLQKLTDKFGTNLDAVTDGSQLSLFVNGIENRDDQIPTWDGEAILGDRVYICGEYDTSKDPLGWEISSLVITVDGETSYKLNSSQVINFFQEGLKTDWIITDNGKALLHSVLNLGLHLQQRLFDLSYSTYLLSGGSSKQTLEGIAAYYHQPLGDTLNKLQILIAAFKDQQSELKSKENLRKLVEVENNLLLVVAQMERTGIALDKEVVATYQTKLTNLVKDLEQQIYHNVGHEFNISSPKQVGEVLFAEKGLTSGKKTKTGGYSTDERILKEIIHADPVVGLILQYREVTKLLSTYVVPLPTYINPQTNKIHGTFNQLGALTGRFSSQNPNMQNIPVGDVAEVNMRDAFVAAPGTILVAFDYSQQELRLLAQFSQSKSMQDAFRNNIDIHSHTAAEILEKPVEQVSKDERRMGKTINFGIVYGISAFGLADRLKIDNKRAAEFIQKYFAQYPEVKEYYQRLIEEAKVTGEVETILGRKRTTAGLTAANWQIRSATEREVMNFPLQGSAADIVKMAMVKVSNLIDAYPAKLILQVHDELIFEYNTDLSQPELLENNQFVDFVRKIRQTMLEVVHLDVPLAVGVELGSRWGKMEEISDTI